MSTSVCFCLVQEGDNYGDNSQKSRTLILWHSHLPKPSFTEKAEASSLSPFHVPSFPGLLSLPASLDSPDTVLIRLIVSTKQHKPLFFPRNKSLL